MTSRLAGGGRLRQLRVLAALLAACLSTATAPAPQTPAQILADAPLEQRIGDIERRLQDQTDGELRKEIRDESTGWIVALTFWQVIFAGAGTLGLVATVVLTYRSVSQNAKTLQVMQQDAAVSRLIAEPSLRFEGIVYPAGVNGDLAEIRIKNVGPSAAFAAYYTAPFVVAPLVATNIQFDTPDDPYWEDMPLLGRDEEHGFLRSLAALTAAEHAEIVAGTMQLCFKVFVVYRTEFSQGRLWTASHLAYGPNFTQSHPYRAI